MASSSDIYKVGLIGGIGTGKTSIARIFDTLGIPVYNSDEKAKYIMTHNPDIKNSLRQIMGENAFFPDGRLNAKYIRKLLFQNPDLKKKVEQIVHPEVYRDFIRWTAKQKAPYVLLESAVISPRKARQLLDAVIRIHAPKDLRIKWLARSRSLSLETIQSIMKSQKNIREFEKYAHFTIINDGRHSLLRQVLAVHRKLVETIKKRQR